MDPDPDPWIHICKVDPDPLKEIKVDPDPERRLKWIRIRFRLNAVDPGGSGSETLVIII